MIQWLGSLVFTAFLFVWTGVFAVYFAIVAGFASLPERSGIAAGWARVLMAVLRFTCRLDYRVSGTENIPPGANVALWKHSSAWETLVMVLVFPPQVWVLKRELTWIPIVARGTRLLHSIAIDRRSGHTAVQQVVAQGRARIAEGLWVMIFPEGTRMPAGEKRKMGVSGTLLARDAGCLVVPVAHDAGYYWPRRGVYKKPGVIDVRIGEPIDPAGRDLRQLNEEVQAWIEGAIREMRAAKARGP